MGRASPVPSLFGFIVVKSLLQWFTGQAIAAKLRTRQSKAIAENQPSNQLCT
ncbi:hypothetical protein H6F44_07575 [Pseudanabaena sp. FACHB-1277]|uniref:Uncharacterized protein n=1 Tax=Pseudanabaena cinerea FACHB-1277 TaxID=2949581 RepID=A0A926UTZ4_9CYAN|nr:hypothetical protein [Pseudanabaena cinerea]MBD2149980.1 hypothetical protein [Pseudanabaena cinerea FACHB-1277]